MTTLQNLESGSNYDARTQSMNFLGIFFSAMVYGLHVCLFLTCLRPVLKRGRWLGAYICMLFVLATVGITLQVYWYEVAFIDHLNDPGGPYQFLEQNVRHPVNIALTVVYLLLNWFSDGIVLYRFFVIYSVPGSRSVVIGIASAIMLTALVVTGSVFVPHIASLGSNLWTDISTTPGIAYLTLSLSINTILTFLIIGRIVYFSRLLRRIGPVHCDQYTSIITLIVESAALYTFWALISVIACGISSRVQFVLLPVLGQLQAIPPLLILARVANGLAVTQNTYTTSMSAVTNIRLSTTCSDPVPPYTKSEKDAYGRQRSSSFASSIMKVPLNSEVEVKNHIYVKRPDFPDIETGVWPPSPATVSFLHAASPIDAPQHVHHAI